jgi:transposase
MSKLQRVRNWNNYNRALKKRGAIIFTFCENYLEELYYSGVQEKGGARRYSDKMYEYLLTVKLLFRFPWRQTIGFAEGMFGKVFKSKELRAPDYAHASRSSGKLKLRVKNVALKEIGAGKEIAFDSTGVNIYDSSGWHLRKYGKNNLCSGREQWKKIHVAIDLDSMEVLSVAYTDSNINDCEVVSEMSKDIKGKIKEVIADGAYDTAEFRKIIHNLGARDLIPPARTSKTQDELRNKTKTKKEYLAYRDEVIKGIREHDSFDEGLKAWKISSGYHKRSRVESFMFRFKKTFGFNLQQKTEQGRKNEVIAKVNILNQMIALGKAEYFA